MIKNYLNFKKFKNKVNFGFFTSKGGVSNGDYYSLNCSKANNDKKKNVSKNIKIALKQLGINNKKLKLINQIHSNKIYFINKKNFKNELYGDGLITKDKDIALGVLTADCAPIFIFDNNKQIICCLHSGWKGTLSNIIEVGVNKLKNNKIDTKNIFAVVGPCLSFNNFEVDKTFKLRFIKKNISYKKFFKSKNNKKDLFNMRGLLNFQLRNAGVENIANIKKDTFKNYNDFFSHRRTTRKDKQMTGRMINIISMLD